MEWKLEIGQKMLIGPLVLVKGNTDWEMLKKVEWSGSGFLKRAGNEIFRYPETTPQP